MPAKAGDDAQIGKLAAAAAPLLAQYAKQCDKAIDLSGVDPNVGAGAMRAAEDTFAELDKDLQGLGARSDALHAERADAADARSLHSMELLGLLTLLVTGGALAAAWRMQRRVVVELGHAVRLGADVAAGRLDVAAHSERDDEIGELMRALGHMVARLRESLQTVRQATDHIGIASQEIATGNTDLSQRTEAGCVQPAADRQFDGAAHRHRAPDRRLRRAQANQLAASASSVAQRGGDVVLAGGLDDGRDQRQLAARSPTSSAPSTASRSRPTSWRSTPRSRPRAPASRAAASRSWPARCAASRSARPRPPRRSRA